MHKFWEILSSLHFEHFSISLHLFVKLIDALGMLISIVEGTSVETGEGIIVGIIGKIRLVE